MRKNIFTLFLAAALFSGCAAVRNYEGHYFGSEAAGRVARDFALKIKELHGKKEIDLNLVGCKVGLLCKESDRRSFYYSIIREFSKAGFWFSESELEKKISFRVGKKFFLFPEDEDPCFFVDVSVKIFDGGKAPEIIVSRLYSVFGGDMSPVSNFSVMDVSKGGGK